MQFKEWFYLQEVMDDNAKKIITSQINKELAGDEKKLRFALDLLDKMADPENKEDYGSNIKDIRNKIFADPQLKKEKSVDGLLSKVDRFNTIEFDGTQEDKENIKQTLKYFFDQGTSNDQLEEMMHLLRRFIPEKKIKLEFDGKPILFVRNADRGWEQVSETGFTQFSAHLHAIDSMSKEQKSASHYFNPITEFDQDKHLVAKGDNIWVFKGGRPDICRKLGKGQSWCISSTTSAGHWFDYRIDHGQTQYFIFDFNWPEGHPARYVNPGVAPEGEYSEWVDFRNYPNQIEGFSSIQKYKKYLSDKGVEISVFKADPIKTWERRLKKYVNQKDVGGARKDTEIDFDLFLKIVEKLEDKDFNSLNDEQKKTYLLGRIRITENQFNFAFEHLRKDYLNSLNFNDGGITFLVESAPLNKRQDMAKLIIQKKTELKDFFDVLNLLEYATDRQEIAKLIIQKKTELDGRDSRYLLIYATNRQEIAGILGSENINKMNEDDIHEMLRATTKNKFTERDSVYVRPSRINSRQEIVDILGPENINKLSHDNVFDLLLYSTDLQEIADILGSENTNKLRDEHVFDLLNDATDKQKMAKLLGSEKINKLYGHHIRILLSSATDKQEMADILGSENINKLIPVYVSDLLLNATDKQEMVKILGSENINKLTSYEVSDLLHYATDKQEMADILGSENINKLVDWNVSYLINYADDKQEMAKAILKNLPTDSKLSSETIEKLKKAARGEF